jgi:four helix bundle protein
MRREPEEDGRRSIENSEGRRESFGADFASRSRMRPKTQDVGKILNFRDLEVWQKSMVLAESCYKAVGRLPASERFGLALQMRRAAVSIPSNIAEGHQLPTASYRHHVSIALGAVAELQTQVELAGRLGFTRTETVRELEQGLCELRQMLARLRNVLGDQLKRQQV